MLSVFLFGILTGLDNFQLSSALGLSGIPQRRKWLVVSIFAFFEMVMPVVGVLLGNGMKLAVDKVAPWLAASLLLVVGLSLLVRSLRNKREMDFLSKGWLVVPLAFMMSLDNLAAGVGFGANAASVFMSALAMGLSAALLCVMGLFVGDKVRRFVPTRIEMVTGCWLIGLAICKIVLK
ncbi:MAG: manganese efflux pump [Armatimonadetes bacterium]|nr:manganese efflux pump [Armatimonadota bacterium]